MKILLFLYIILSPVLLEDVDKENDVLILNSENFDDIISDNKPILINFYAPWCQFSQKLKPHFERVAQDFSKQNINVKLGKVDVVLETELAQRFNIKRYPTLIFFKEDRQIYYNKTNNYMTISNWLISKTENLVLTINSKDEYEATTKNNAVVITIDQSHHTKQFDLAAESIDDTQFVVSNSALFTSLFPDHNGPLMVITRKEDQVTIPYRGTITVEEIRKFSQTNDLPPVVIFSPTNGPKIFNNPYKPQHFLVFVNSNTDSVKKELKKAAQNHDDTRFAIMDVTNNVTDNIVAYFKVDKDKVPYMILSDVQGKKIYRPDFEDINGDLIDGFISDVKSGKVEQFLKSQPVPDNWDSEPLKVLVGKNFEQVAYDKSKHVFVEFYAPWCSHCKQLAPIWERLAQSLASVPDLVIAKLDKTENDIRGIEITAFPTLKLFLKDTNEMISYSGLRTKEALTEFLSKHTDVKVEKNKHEL